MEKKNKNDAQKNWKVLGSEYYDLGATKTRNYEDRGAFQRVRTRSGLELYVGIVADGVGGGNLGQRAAQLTVDTILQVLRRYEGPPTQIPQLLGQAIGMANKLVYREAYRETHKKRGMSSTVAMAVIHNRKLYVANVGDSRVYLLRKNGDEIIQLTQDHTYANEKIRQGVLTPQQAYSHPNAEAITRSVGYEPQITVDLGLYLSPEDKGQQAYQNQGLPLEDDDVVLICSDGLIKPTQYNPQQHFVEPEEIQRTVKQYHAEEAAKVLVDLALGRNVDDNVTAVVMEFPGRKIQRHFLKSSPARMGIVAVLLAALVFIGVRWQKASEEVTQLVQQGTATAQAYQAMTATVAAYTPTPTRTPRAPLAPGEIGYLGSERVRVDQKISLVYGAALHINHESDSEYDGIIVSGQDSTQVLFRSEPDDILRFDLFPGGSVLVWNGRYVESRITLVQTALEVRVSGSLMSVEYRSPEEVVITCLEGQCAYNFNYTEWQPILPHEVVVLDASLEVSLPARDQSVSLVAQEWVAALAGSAETQTEYYRILLNLLPTPTPELVDTPPPPTEPPPTEPPPTEPPTTEPPPTEPPTTEPPTTEPPTTEPPPPKTEPPPPVETMPPSGEGK